MPNAYPYRRDQMSRDRFKSAALLIGIAAAMLAGAPPTVAQQPAAVVLKGGTLIDGTGAPPVANAVVVIKDGKFEAVGDSTLKYPADARVVDLSGKFIIPGLVESHVHYEEWMGEMFLNHGITSVFGLAVGGRFPPGLTAKKELSYRTESRMPRLYLIGEGNVRLSPSMTEDAVRQGVRAYLKQNPDFAGIGTFTAENAQAYGWAADEVHRAGLLVFGHTDDAPASIRAGQDIVEHVWGFALAAMSPEERADFERGKFLHWGTFLGDRARVKAMITEAVSRGAIINPTLMFEFGSPDPLAKRHEAEMHEAHRDHRLMAYYPRNIADALLRQIAPFRNFSAKYPDLVAPADVQKGDAAQFQRAFRLTGEFLSQFVAAGGKIHAGTDAPSGGTPGLSLHHELDLLVAGGLTPLQALQSATGWPGEILGGRDAGKKGRPTVGVITSGALADAVVLTADPLQAIGNTRKIERVMKGGQFIELGYDPAYFTFTSPPRSVAMATPVPAISAISPYDVVEGSATFDITVHGAGFVSDSLVQVDGESLATTFVSTRVLKAKIPARMVQAATPVHFAAHGAPQKPGVIGDRIVPIVVFTPHPDSGSSNTVFLRVKAKWYSQTK